MKPFLPFPRTRTLLPLLVALSFSPILGAQDDPPVAAIFVENRAGPAFAEKTGVLEDLLTARFTELGFSVMSREVAIDALDPAPGDGEASLEERLSSRTSALRLAQNLGADTVLSATITSWGQNQRRYQGHGVETDHTENILRVSYRLFDGVRGGSLYSDTVRVSKVHRNTADLTVTEGDLLNELLDGASAELAGALARQTRERPAPARREMPGPVNFDLDISLRNLTIPDVHVDAEGNVTLSSIEHEMAPYGVTVELDGVAIGSAPGTLEAFPGLHTMRLSRDGFRDWERTVNLYDGLELHIAMEPSEEGLARWRDYTEFLNDLQTGTRLAEAEIEVLKGYAQQLRQSGYRIDIRIDTDEGIRIDNHYRSLFGEPLDPRQ